MNFKYKHIPEGKIIDLKEVVMINFMVNLTKFKSTWEIEAYF